MFEVLIQSGIQRTMFCVTAYTKIKMQMELSAVYVELCQEQIAT